VLVENQTEEASVIEDGIRHPTNNADLDTTTSDIFNLTLIQTNGNTNSTTPEEQFID